VAVQRHVAQRRALRLRQLPFLLPAQAFLRSKGRRSPMKSDETDDSDTIGHPGFLPSTEIQDCTAAVRATICCVACAAAGKKRL